jgi:hypothetical protein
VFCDSYYQEWKTIGESWFARPPVLASVPAGAKKNSSDSQEELFNMF